jgi:hypothetical protein
MSSSVGTRTIGPTARTVQATLDGYASHNGNWGGDWGKQGPELLEHRLASYRTEQRMVFGAKTYRQFVQLLQG